jgi:hypothetical protein
MQRQTLLVSTAVFALLACAAWFLSAREPAPAARAPLPVAQLASPVPAPAPTHSPPRTAAPATAMPAAASTPRPTAPAATPTPRPAAAARSAEADGAADEADDTAADPAQAGAVGDVPPGDSAGAQPASAMPADIAVAGTSPAMDTPADAADAGSPPTDPAQDAPSPATITDPHDDRAADLFAQRIEALDDPHIDDAQDARAAAAQQAYEARDEGGDAAKATQAILHDVFAGWLASLHLDSSHPSLISIDCRSGACRVLIAQAGIDFAGAAQLERESPVNAFSRALTEFSQGAVWNDAGLALQDSQMTAAGGSAEKANDIALWTIYVRVAATE